MNKKIQIIFSFSDFKMFFYDFFEAKDAKHHFFYSQILRSCPWMTWQQAHLFGVVKCSSWVPFKDLLKFPVSWINRQFKWMSFYKRRENLEKTLSRRFSKTKVFRTYVDCGCIIKTRKSACGTSFLFSFDPKIDQTDKYFVRLKFTQS